MIFLVAITVVIGSCTGNEKRPPAVGSACQGSSCKTDSEQTSSDANANRVEQLTTTINTLKQAITNNRRLSAAEVDTLQQQLEEKNTELQTVSGDQNAKVIGLEQTINELQGELADRKQEIKKLNAEHETKINEIIGELSDLQDNIIALNAQTDRDQRDLENLQKQLTNANETITELEGTGADLSQLRDKVTKLEGLLAQQQSSTDEGSVSEAPEEETPPATTQNDCQAKLCAYYQFSKGADERYFTEGRVVVEKGATAGKLTITSGKVYYWGEDKLILVVAVVASESDEEKCYYAKMEEHQLFDAQKPLLKKLIPKEDMGLCQE